MELEQIITKVYFKANARFPQTRFYFCLALLSEVDVAVLNPFIQNPGKTLRSLPIDKCLAFGLKMHRRYKVPTTLVTKSNICNDIVKSLKKTALIVEHLSHHMDNASISNIAYQILSKIDLLQVSRGYVSFLAGPETNQHKSIKRISTEFSPLNELFTILMQDASNLELPILYILQEEIIHTVSVVR